MATSSSGSSCGAPADFQLSSELDDPDERDTINLMKCPLCQNGRKNFYCKQCVQNGEFAHTAAAVHYERFVEKQQRLSRLKVARNQLEEKCTKILEKHKHRDKLICDINACKERLRLLKNVEIEVKKNLKKDKKRLSALKDINSQITEKLPKHVEQLEKLKKRTVDIEFTKEKQKECVERKRQQLKKRLRVTIKQLVDLIFPLGKVEPKSEEKEQPESCTDLVTCALADASGTSYVRGKWINDTENSLEVQHRIVAPTLPGSGDYSAYTLWMAENRDTIISGNRENAMHNPAYSINAALAYTTQLVTVIADYLNVHLPYKLLYNEFNSNDLTDQRFARKVARLNSNILHLCFTQNTDIKVLHPKHTLQNVMHLLNTDISDLGRIGPIEVEHKVIEDLYNQLVPDLENSDDSASDDEEEDPSNWDWEAVPNVSFPEMNIPNPAAMGSQQSMQVNSVAGGLVTSAAASIASIWRGWATNK